jgi:hypothetical protein
MLIQQCHNYINVLIFIKYIYNIKTFKNKISHGGHQVKHGKLLIMRIERHNSHL